MAKIRDLDFVAKKWGTVTAQRGGEYADGVANPKADWKASTVAADANWKAGVTAAVTGGQFLKGVNKSSTEDWKSMAIKKGVARFGPGVTEAVPAYTKGFGPYRDVIANTVLPLRYPKGAPQNIERVRVMAAALRAKKVAG
jgi:hypothetical protein